MTLFSGTKERNNNFLIIFCGNPCKYFVISTVDLYVDFNPKNDQNLPIQIIDTQPCPLIVSKRKLMSSESRKNTSYYDNFLNFLGINGATVARQDTVLNRESLQPGSNNKCNFMYNSPYHCSGFVMSALYNFETASLQGFTTRTVKSTDDFDYYPTGCSLWFLAGLLAGIASACRFIFTATRKTAKCEQHEILMRETAIVCPGITPVKHGRPKLSLSWHDRPMLNTCRADAKIRPLLLPCAYLNVKHS